MSLLKQVPAALWQRLRCLSPIDGSPGLVRGEPAGLPQSLAALGVGPAQPDQEGGLSACEG